MDLYITTITLLPLTILHMMSYSKNCINLRGPRLIVLLKNAKKSCNTTYVTKLCYNFDVVNCESQTKNNRSN